jgi:HlyD family secretion protein
VAIRASRWVRWIILLALIAAAAVAVRYTWLRPVQVPVTIFRVAAGRVEETVTNSKAGTLKSRRRATLSPEIGGRVEALMVRAGDRVRAGQVLLRLSDADYRAQLELQERSFEALGASARQACQAAEFAERELVRHREMAREQLEPQEVLDLYQSRRDTAATECEAARSRTRQAEAAIALARASLSKTVVTAPFAGVVAEVTTQVGEWITPSPPGLPIPSVLDLFDPDAIYVSAPLDEVDVAKVRAGLPVRITMDAFPGRAFAGSVVRVAPYVLDRQEQNRTFEIEVEFDPNTLTAADRQGLRPGTSVDVEVILGARDGVLRVPSYALIEGKRVMVVRDGRIVSMDVGTGLKNWDFTQIRSGITAGDIVVVSLDRVEVRDGAEVRIQAETLR